MNEQDRIFARLAIDEARKCKSEDDRIHPMVGAVVVKNDKLLDQAHRGELAPGDHAEFTLLEKKLADTALAGGTVFTTLEPCTTRNHPKVCCAQRLAEHRVGRVVIGMLDPNAQITGQGVRMLRDAGIRIDLFPPELMSEVEELNRDFTRSQKGPALLATEDPKALEMRRARGLDEWYVVLNRIYWNRNYTRSASDILGHLVEVVGGISTLASEKRKPGVDPQRHIAKSVAWWLALCGRQGVRSPEALLWDKLPGVCPYCQQERHDPDICNEMKSSNPSPPWEALEQIGKSKEKPSCLGKWQVMFSTIYPAQQTELYGPTFGRLSEELGELSEAVRVFSAEPGYFLSEAADVFAWLMHLQNIVDSKAGTRALDRGNLLETDFAKAYPDCCDACGESVCTCPPILGSTIGRISHDVPRGKRGFEESGRFMTPDRAVRVFQSHDQ